MVQKIIIDGYNVIYTDDRLRRKACKNLEQARMELVEMLRAYVRHRRLQVTVVFDGRGGIVDTESVVPGKLQVMFSAGAQTADELIVSTITESKSPRAYIVVTSDMADIGGRVRSVGGQVMGSKRFLDRMKGDSTDSRQRSPKKERQDYGDTDYWLRKFGADEE